ncbi:hypothetical protein K435DRAFT_696901, partial [Dendrothele bispora CBS 962.96]
IGMPIIIRQNHATELCITNGQEGTVYGWQAATGPEGQSVLDTLFVKLTKPPKTIEISGLPENVIPLSRSSQTTTCMLPNDSTLTIKREQVMILPNFAMTDYVAQGKTRSENIIHCAHLKNHHAYYTAFSRSSNADGIILLDDIDVRKIQKGISGFLRQEFRELMLLDELTELRYNHMLDPKVNGETRNQLLRSYQKIKGNNYNPAWLPHALSSQCEKDSKFTALAESSHWQLVGQKSTVRSNNIGEINPETNVTITLPDKKKQKVDRSGTPRIRVVVMCGIMWDPHNWSCPYDTLLTLVYNLWQEDIAKWSPILRSLTPLSNELIDHFVLFTQQLQTLEQARDIIRRHLYMLDPGSFPYGQMGGHIDLLAHHLFGSITYSSTNLFCRQCNTLSNYSVDRYLRHEINPVMDIYPDSKWSSQFTRPYYVQDWINNYMMHLIQDECPQCRSTLYHHIQITLDHIPPLLYFNIYDSGMNISQKLFLQSDGDIARYTLKAITYSGNYHFSCRLIDAEGAIFYHDGITCGATVQNEQQNVNSISDWFFKTADNGRKIMIGALYTRE